MCKTDIKKFGLINGDKVCVGFSHYLTMTHNLNSRLFKISLLKVEAVAQNFLN